MLLIRSVGHYNITLLCTFRSRRSEFLPPARGAANDDEAKICPDSKMDQRSQLLETEVRPHELLIYVFVKLK